MSEAEYEVESITQARVEKKKGKKSIWKYCVRWKGYGPADDTWEPVESFEGSTDIVERFWERANPGGRDYRDLSVFKPGESFLPLGPPRPKGKRKSLKPGIIVSDSPPKEGNSKKGVEKQETEKRGRSSSVVKESPDRPTKRIRRDVSGSHSAPREDLSPLKEPKRKPLPGRSNGNIFQQSMPTPSPVSSHRGDKRPLRASSIDEVVPPTDEENDEMVQDSLSSPPKDKPLKSTETVGGSSNSDNATGANEKVAEDPNPTKGPDLFSGAAGEDQSPTIPSHRARAVNPRVKMIDEPNLADMEGAISVKARLLAREAPLSSQGRTLRNASGSKPGPGRSSSGLIKKNTSSLLTFEKGALKTVKRRYMKPAEEPKSPVDPGHINETAEDVSLWGGDDVPGDEIPGLIYHNQTAPPTGEELLELAGFDPQNAEALPDFEDGVPSMTQTPLEPQQDPQLDEADTALQHSLTIAKDKLFPMGSTSTLTNDPNAAWKRSTIFGPLGLGSDSTHQLIAHTESSYEPTQSPPFSLNLDTSVVVPVVLINSFPSRTASPSLDFIVGNRGPPGKFFSEQAALALLDTLRTGGPSSRIIPASNASEEEKAHFERFHSRLDVGDLFIAMAGVEVLAFCSSDNALVAQRLNLHPDLLIQKHSVLVSRVVIENYSAYADAALNADSRRWSQYILPD